MNALNAFLYGMPFVLMVGAGVTLWFAKRAAADIRKHHEPKSRVVVLSNSGPAIVTRMSSSTKVNEAA